jgi:hypothetical protein
MNRTEGGPQAQYHGEANTPTKATAGTSRRVITGSELAARRATSSLWKHSRFLVEWRDDAGRVHTAGNYRITRGRPDGTTETVRYLDSPGLRDTYADNFQGEATLKQLHGGASIPVDVYQLTLKGDKERRRLAYDGFIRTAQDDGYNVRRCEIDLPSATLSPDDEVSSVTFFVHRTRPDRAVA